MKFASSWRLSIALAAVALLAAFATWPGSGPPSAEADVDTATPSSMYGDDGSTISIDIEGDEAADGLDIDVTVTGSSLLTLGTCEDELDGPCPEGVAGPAAAVSWTNVNAPYEATVALTLDCDEPEAVTVTATHNGDSAQAVVYCVPELNDPQVQIEKQSNDSGDYEFDWDASGGDCLVIADDGTVEFDDAGSFDLEDNDNAEFYCETSVSLVVDEDNDADFVEIDDCDEGDDGIDDISGARVEFDISELGAGETVFCTWVNDDDFDPTPSVGPVTTVAIILSDANIECGSSTLVQVVPRSSNGGPAPAGSTVSVTSSLGGGFQPGTSVTSGFPISLVNFLYTAPDDVDGITTITARAGNVQTTAAVQIVCDEAPSAPPTTTPGPLLPPSAGSGGLVGSSGSAYMPAALAVAAAIAVLGLTAATRRFAMASDGVVESFAEPVADTRQPGSFALLLSLAMLVVALMSRRWR